MNKALSNNVIWLLVAGYFLWVLADPSAAATAGRRGSKSLESHPLRVRVALCANFRPRTDCERRVRAASAAIARSSERQRSRAESGEDRERAKG
jgi:hypothetical protein